MSNVIDFMIPVKFKREKQTATNGQTLFTLTTITVPNADSERVIVSVNGREQPSDAFIVNSATTLTSSEAMEGGEIVQFTIASHK